jgi:hypothetical protein
VFRRNERGVVLPTRLLALSVSAIAAAALVYIVNDPDEPNDQATPTVSKQAPATASESADPTASATPKATRKPQPIKRGKTLVEIFNNTRTKGLAGHTAGTATAAGWNVVGTDNWYGTIDATTVFYPPKLEAAARALGRDLGIKKIRPAEDPMHFDRITVILTDGYHG